jgi:hypothetical protein
MFSDFVVLGCDCDWANVGYGYQEALRAVGVNATCVALKPHPFGYEKGARVVTSDEMSDLFENADVIINMHSHNLSGPRPGKLVGVFHGGNTYRNATSQHNAVFNEFCAFSLVQTGDLMGHGARNEHMLMPPIDSNAIRPRIGIMGDRITVAHYPRSGAEKGTANVKAAFKKLAKHKAKPILLLSESRLPWPENIGRMGDCDIYVESCAPTHTGHKFGAWGITALEAACLGKIVVTNDLYTKEYCEIYGDYPIQVANSSEEIVKRIKELLAMSRDDLENLQVDTRQWAEEKHSFAAVGSRLARIIMDAKGTRASQHAMPKPEEKQKIVPFVNPVSQQQIKATWDVRGCHTWVEAKVRNDEYAHLFHLLSRNGIISNGKILGSTLEVGQGVGHWYRWLSRTATSIEAYTAVDWVNSTRFRFRQYFNVLPDYWDGTTLSYTDSAFDLLMAIDVTGYIHPSKIKGVLQEFARVSRRWVLMSAQIRGTTGSQFDHDYDSLFGEAGFSIVASRPTGNGSRRAWLLRKTPASEK